MSVMNFIENISPFMKLTNYFREGGEVCDCIKIIEYESQDKADYLHNQLITDINVPSTYWECAESYLKGVGIYDVFLIEEQDFRNYKIFLRETGNFTKKQVFERLGSCEI